MTDSKPSEPASYRDLIHAQANGQPVDEVKLAKWRREETLVRSAIENPESYRDLGLKAAHFEAPIHAIAWESVMRLLERHPEYQGRFSEAAVVTEMCEIDESLGGNVATNFVDAIMHDDPLDPHFAVPVVAKQQFQNHRNRRWSATMSELIERVDGDKDVLGLQADMVRTSANIVFEAQGDGQICQPMDEYDWDPDAPSTESLIRFGFGPLDMYTAGGHGRGEMMVIGGGTGHGKTYSCLHLLRCQARLKQRVLYISCEDGYELIYCRTLASFSEPALPPGRIRQKKADPELVKQAQTRMRDEYAGNVFIAVAKKPTISQVCQLIHTHRFAKDVDLVIVDYLQAISADEPMHNKVQEMAMVTSTLKRTAHQCGVGLVVTSQYARDQYRDGAEPDINACKYCGDIENEAEIMVMLWRDSDQQLCAKIPKVKWAAAGDDLRFHVMRNDKTGAHLDWKRDRREEGKDD